MENHDLNKPCPTWAVILALFIGGCIVAFTAKLKFEPEDSASTETQMIGIEARDKETFKTRLERRIFQKYGCYNYYSHFNSQARSLAESSVKKESFDYELTECERRHKPKKDYCERCKYDIDYRDRKLEEIENDYDNAIERETENIINRWKKNGIMFDPQGRKRVLLNILLVKKI